MASWLSSRRMTRSWQRLFGRGVTVLALLLAAQLAHAGEACFSALGLEAPALQPTSQGRCLNASAAPDACIAAPQRIGVGAAGVAPLSPEPPPVVGGPETRAIVFRTACARLLPAGLAPASPSPVYILFRRYLS